MSALSLKDLHQRIVKQDADLQRLRQELAARQSQFASLNQRRQKLQMELLQVEKELAAVAAGKKASSVAAMNGSKMKPGAKPSVPSKKTAPLSLPAMIVAIIGEAGRPLSVQQLVAQVKQRGFRSTSANFDKMLKTRLYDLLKKGLIKRTVDQSGFVLARSGAQKH
jgi:septal ring factor EnvC (AmiA/AmiB activator)